MSHCPILNNLQRNKKVKSGKIKIGLIGEQFRNHSVWNAITKGWLFNLDKNKFEVHIFDLGNVCDDQTKFAKKIAASYTKKQYSIIEWANVIVSKDIEVLIYPEIGMHALTLQLANLRLSSIQIAAWGHPETSGLPTIDYFISAELFETAYSQNAYTENLIKLPNLGCNFSRNPNPTSDIDMQKFGLDAEVPILLCPGVPFKYAPDYDWVIVDIAKRLGKCKLVFFNYQKNWTSIFKMRLEKSFNNANLILDDYVIFLPWLKTAEFYGLMKRADLFLDTIGFSGFNTAMQAIECALPIVTREGKFMRGRLASGILKRMGMSELITNTEEKYIELAVNLAKDQEYRNRVSEKIIEMRDILYEDVDPIRALEDFLIIKCRRYHDSEF
jgi:predicted O-linked N-acetylglucosamine transferase (SPINDLY family)